MRVRTALTCGTDVKLLERGHAAVALPVTMGHEACGEIVEVGEGVEGFRAGERVVPGISGPCGACAVCSSGHPNLCPEGHSDRTWGAFAELLRVPAAVVRANLHRVPGTLADEVAAFLDPLAAVFHGWNRLGEPAPRTLLIYGAGALGLLAADAAVDCTGDPRVWELLPSLVRPGGRVLLFGGCAPGASVTYDAARLHYSEVSLIGSFHSTPEEARTALAELASGQIDPRPILTASGPLSELPRFLEAQSRGDGIRYAIHPES